MGIIGRVLVLVRIGRTLQLEEEGTEEKVSLEFVNCDRTFLARTGTVSTRMDVHLHGACMGKLVGPAGGGGGAGGGGISTQFRILPNSLSSDCYSVDSEKVPVAGHRPALHLKASAPTPPHRTFSPEPLKIGDEYLPSGSNSPLPGATTGFLLHDAPAAVRRPSLTHSTSTSSSSSSSSPKQITDGKFVLDDGDGAPKALETESPAMVIN